MLKESLTFKQATDLYRQGKPDEAVNILLTTIEADPSCLKAYSTLGAIYEAWNKPEEAIEVYTSALKINLDDPRINYRLGILQMRRENYPGALTSLRMSWSNDQKNPHVANALAFVLHKTNDFATARLMYEAALMLNPKLFDALLNLGSLHYYQERYESAISCFVTYLVKAGENSYAHLYIGKCMLGIGQFDTAISYFKRAINLEPNCLTNYFNIAVAHEMQGNLSEALVNYQHVLDLDDDHIEARYNKGKMLRSLFREEEAMMELSAVLRRNPRHISSLNCLATCFLNRQSYTDAIKLLQEAIEISPGYSDAQHNLGIALSNIGRYENALHHFEEAVRLNPGDTSSVEAAQQLWEMLYSPADGSQNVSDLAGIMLKPLRECKPQNRRFALRPLSK